MSAKLQEPSLSVVNRDNKNVTSPKEPVKWKRGDLVKSLKQAELKSLISLEVPPEACLSERLDRMLAWQEHVRDLMKILPLYGLTKQDCQSTLESIIGVTERLKRYEKLPKNGLCVHSGLVVAKNGQEKRLTFEYEPIASTDHKVAHSVDGPDSEFRRTYLNSLTGHSQDENIFINADASELLSEVEVSDCETEATASNSPDKAQQESAIVASIRLESGGGKTNDASTNPMLAKNKNVWKISRLLEGLIAAKDATHITNIYGIYDDRFIFLTTDSDIQKEISSADNCLHECLNFSNSPDHVYGKRYWIEEEMLRKSEHMKAIRDRLALYPSVRKSNVLLYSALVPANDRKKKRLTLDIELSIPEIERVDEEFKGRDPFASLKSILTYLGDKDVLIDDETSKILSKFLKGRAAKGSCSTAFALPEETNKRTVKPGHLVKWKRCDLAKSLKRAELKSIISLTIPPGACLRERLDHMLSWQNQVRFLLESPLYNSDKQDCRSAGQSALEGIMEVTERLKRYENIPGCGLCIYSGLVVAKDGQESRLTFEVSQVSRSSSSLFHHDTSGPSSSLHTYYMDSHSWEYSDLDIFIDAQASAILSELLSSKPEVIPSISSDEAQLDSLVASRSGSFGCKTNDVMIIPMLPKNRNVRKISRLLEGLLASENVSQIEDFNGWRKDHFLFLKPNDDIQEEINSLDNYLLEHLKRCPRLFHKNNQDSLLEEMRDGAEAREAIRDRLALYPNVRKSIVLFYTGLVESRDGKTEKRRLTFDIELSLPGIECVDAMLTDRYRVGISLRLISTYLGDVDVFIDDATSEILSDFLASRDTQGKCSSALPLPESHNNKGKSRLNNARLFMRKLGKSARQVAARVFCCLG